MLLTCPSCNSRYLLNSADLKPKGRTVKCSICIHEWFQEPDQQNDQTSKIPDENSSLSNNLANETIEKNLKSNLPSTLVKEKEPKILNSILVVLFIFIIIAFFWLMNNTDQGTMSFMFFYIEEFYFNLKLIINDFAKIFYQLLN